MIRIEPLAGVPAHAMTALLDSAFGPGRTARPAYAIRRGMAWLPRFSYAAHDPVDGVLLGLLQCWPVALTMADGTQAPLIMVGPVAVLPEYQTRGTGRAMMDRLMADIDAGDAGDPLMMIGDEAYYGRFWGFQSALTHGWDVPAGVDPARLLARRASPDAAPVPAAGRIGPRRPATVPAMDAMTAAT